jgi:TolB-like protein/Tfp pilus assembly protein PilF
MSPEQARGKTLDARSDIWSFGCVLYEMLSGRCAFWGATVSDILAAILKDEPDWGALPSGSPDRMVPILRRCLAKQLQRRFHHIADARVQIEDVLAVLRSSDRIGQPAITPAETGATGAPVIKSIAVLPLANLSGDKDQEYFSDGMTEALITDLAKVGALKVISRTSAMRFKGSDAPLPVIARELGVDAIVEGSVLRAGDEVRITAQLIDAASDTHLWADSYDRDMTNILSLQREVAQAIVREVEVAVTPEEKEHLEQARPVDPEAYEAYLKGRFHWHKITPDHLETALQYFKRAMEKDPSYARAHAGVAVVWLIRAFWGAMPLEEAVPVSKASVRRALDLDDSVAEGHHVKATIKMYFDWDWSGAEASFKRAMTLDPSYVDARLFYSQFLVMMRRFEEAEAEMQRALEIDPLNSFSQGMWGVELLHMRRYQEATAQLRKSLRMEPDLPMTLHSLWIALYQEGQLAEACATAGRFYAALGDREVSAAMARAYAEADDSDVGYAAAMRAAAEVLVSRADTAHVPPARIALLYYHAGDKDPALDWLVAAFEEHSPDMVMLQVWHWDAISDDLRFRDLVRRMKFPEVPDRQG